MAAEREATILSWLALARLLAHHEFRRLGGLTRLLVIDRDDLYQSGVVGLISAVDGYDPERALPQTYFARRIRGAIYDFVRSFPYVQWTGQRLERVPLLNLGSEHDPEFERLEQKADLEALASRLEDQQREVILSLMAGIPAKQTAARMGVSSGRVSQIKTESVQALRSLARSP